MLSIMFSYMPIIEYDNFQHLNWQAPITYLLF